MSYGIAIFVKTPGFSPVKTRVAATMGTGFAESLHRRAAAATASVVESALAGTTGAGYWAVAETDAAARTQWTGLPTISQEEGTLGERLGRVYNALVAQHGRAILVGADSPQLEIDHLLESIDWLHAADPRFVIGPARDGGFWLAGGNRPLPRMAWMDIEYSRADTGAALHSTIQRYGATLELPTLSDVDHSDDVPRLTFALRALARATPAQASLLAWLTGGTDA